MTTTVAVEDPAQPEIIALIAEADAYSDSLYPAESNHPVDVLGLKVAGAAFYVVRVDGVIGGFGAILPKDGGDKDSWGEVKRMYVVREKRGLGLGRKVLQALEGYAQGLGLKRLRLETGIHNLEALSLYRSTGFHEIPPFPPYRSDPLSLFMEKLLN